MLRRSRSNESSFKNERTFVVFRAQQAYWREFLAVRSFGIRLRNESLPTRILCVKGCQVFF